MEKNIRRRLNELCSSSKISWMSIISVIPFVSLKSTAIITRVMLTMEGFQNALATTISRPVSSEYSKCADAIINAAHAFLSGNAELDATAEIIEAALAG